MDHDDLKSAVNDSAVQLTLSQRAAIRMTMQAIHHVFRTRDTAPAVALTAMLNMIGFTISGFNKVEQVKWVEQIQRLLPMYVRAYETGEKKVSQP